MSDSVLSTVESALEDYAKGRMVIVVDDEDRENEGDLVLAADFVTPDAINFMVTHARGLVCLAMRGALLDRLQIPMMVPATHNRSGFGTGFTLSVEASHGVSTGISAEDRAHTIRTLISPDSTPSDIAMPGHIFPLRARDGGVLERRGQTEASVDMSALAGLTPAGVICEVMRDDGGMMRLDELSQFARTYQLKIISVEQIAQFRLINGQGNMATSVAPHAAPDDAEISNHVIPLGSSTLPTEHGEFNIQVFKDKQGLEHAALVKGDLRSDIPIVRLHSECLTGDAFGSLRCDCGPQLQKAMQLINQHGSGIVLYLRQEGRGIGLGNKIRAYELQDKGRDTVDANRDLGFPDDARDYDVAADILRQLGVDKLKLLSNNPAKLEALTELGIQVVERLPLIVAAHSHNERYLKTKQDKLGHIFNT
ncbi:MAG: GTP cyclohydrolase II [Granulosicoccus sp.]|nr:GTP cyclohydrolase II [Granulosicoccus sp.]